MASNTTDATKAATEPARADASLAGLIGLSDEDLLRISSENPNVRIERRRDGGLSIMSPAGSGTSGRNAEINGQLWAWNRETGLGRQFDSSGGFSRPDGSMRAPDAAWVVQNRWDALSNEQQEGYAPLCPDFVVELVSPSDSLPSQQAKMIEWIENGARLAWLIDPKTRCVWIYRPAADAPELLEDPGSATADESLMPGFVLDLSRVFD